MVVSVESRLGQLEGALSHLATKADVANIETKIATVETRIANELKVQTRWFIGVLIGIASVVLLALRVLPST